MTNLPNNSDFKQWLTSLKTRIRQSQIKAAIKVNEELLRLYWDLGRDIVVRQMDAEWGSGFFDRLSQELRAEFPEMKGFSWRNLYNMKQFYQFYTQDDTIRHQLGGELENKFLQQVVAKTESPILHQLGAKLQIADKENDIIRQQVVDEFKVPLIFQIPWGHHIQIFTTCKSPKEALFYIKKTVENGWSRAVLMNFLDADLYHKQGKALNNFDRLLPEVQSDLAKEVLKDPYNFDFLTLTENYKERELETALSENITKMLLELGKGFAFVGRQVPIKAGSKRLCCLQ